MSKSAGSMWAGGLGGFILLFDDIDITKGINPPYPPVVGLVNHAY